MTRVVVRSSFAADVTAQVAWLRAHDRADWVPRLRTGVAEVRALLARFPAAGTSIEERDGIVLRKLVLRQLPFAAYVVGPDEVTLLRLFHTRQDRPRRRGRGR